jgi:hypothetical protein
MRHPESRMRRAALAILLIFALTPFASELGEWAMHFVVHGDFAHASGHRETTPQDEHGCTPLMHLCGCHTGVCDRAGERRAEVTVGSLSTVAMPQVERTGRLQDAPPHRPPLA